MRYYKWMADGKPIYGRGTYAPPGEWQPRIEGKLEMCWRGYHVCTADQVPYWCGTELIEVEVRDEDIVDRTPDKILCRTWREIRRFHWTGQDMVEYARICASLAPIPVYGLAANDARYVALELAANDARYVALELAANAAQHVTNEYERNPAAASESAAHAAYCEARCVSPKIAAAAVRQRQKAWIEDRIGEKLT